MQKMGFLTITGILCLFSLSLADLGYDGIDQCSRPYQLVYHHEHDGKAVAGSKTALKNAVLRGAIIRVSVTSVNGGAAGNHIVSHVNNVNIRGSEVCASVLDHVGQNGFTHMPTTVWWYQLFCTTGSFHTVNHEIDGNKVNSEGLGTAAVSWFAWDPSPCPSCISPVYSHFLDGGTHTGHLANLINAVEGGKDIQILRRDIGYMTPLDMIQVVAGDNSSVNGQNVWHTGQSYAADGVTYNTERPYRWLSSWSSTGRRHNQRWEYGGQTVVLHNVDNVALEWFVDPCWRLAYSHSETGAPLKGALTDLVTAIDEGHRVRVKFGSKVMEARILKVAPDGSNVHAQLIEQIAQKGGVGEDKTDFVDDAHWIWTFIDTSGAVTANHFRYGTNTEASPATVGTTPVSWYVDTRPWQRAVDVATGGAVKSGTKAALQTAIRSGANVRIKMVEGPALPKIYLQGDNAIYYVSTGEDSAAQGMRVLAQDPAKALVKPPQWNSYLVNTKGEVEIVTYNYGVANSFVSTDTKNADLTFFVDDHIPVAA